MQAFSSCTARGPPSSSAVRRVGACCGAARRIARLATARARLGARSEVAVAFVDATLVTATVDACRVGRFAGRVAARSRRETRARAPAAATFDFFVLIDSIDRVARRAKHEETQPRTTHQNDPVSENVPTPGNRCSPVRVSTLSDVAHAITASTANAPDAASEMVDVHPSAVDASS